MLRKICFVISPIGESGSDVRKRSDLVLKQIVEPAARARGYRAIRADKISRTGVITDHVIQHVVDDPLVVADLTDYNANVFYELALRHAVQKPLVQLIQFDQKIPFDVSSMRTIQVNHRNAIGIKNARAEIVGQIDAAVRDRETETPISHALHRHRGNLILPAWRGHKDLSSIAGPGARRVAVVGQNLASRFGPSQQDRRAFAKELRGLVGRGLTVMLVTMPAQVLQAVNAEAAEDLAHFTLPGLEAIRASLGPLAKRIRVLFHPAATLSLIAVDNAYGYVEPKFQKTTQVSGRLAVWLAPKLFDTASLERMIYDGEKRRHGALLLTLSEAPEVLKYQLSACGIPLVEVRRSDQTLERTRRSQVRRRRSTSR